MTIANDIAAKLLQINAIKLQPDNPFTWASGMRSPIYCDNRVLLSYPDIRRTVITRFEQLASEFKEVNVIAGVATAGIAHGVLLADRLNLPFIYIRSAPKKHGRQNKIEGALPKNAKALLVEDLISTGGSVISAGKALEESGGKIIGALAIFTYELEAAHLAFQQVNYPLRTISSYSRLIQEAVQSGHIAEAEADLLNKWNKDPEEWSNQFLKKMGNKY